MSQASQASNAKLQKAIAAISIKDVSFESFSSTLLNEFDPQFDSRADSLAYQTRVNVAGFEVIETRYETDNDNSSNTEDNPEPEYALRVSVSLGIRLGEAGKLTRNNTDPAAVALIESKMLAYYDINDNNIIEDQDAIEEFVLQNAAFHVWPYWREFVSSSLQRLSLKKITLPFMKKAQNNSAKSVEAISK
jgi:preprotein translocase subunit SecB